MLQKRRLSLLENVAKELNPEHFSSLLEEIGMHLADAHSEIFDFSYRKLLQQCPEFEQMLKQDSLTQAQKNEVRKLQAKAASTIECLKALVQRYEANAQEACRCQLGKRKFEPLTWDQWIRYMADDSLGLYVDAVFKQSSALGRFPVFSPRERQTMMEKALHGYEYCEKMWKHL